MPDKLKHCFSAVTDQIKNISAWEITNHKGFWKKANNNTV